MDSKKEKLLKKTFDDFIELMLYDFPVERMGDLIAEDVSGYGTTVDEKVLEINRFKKVVTDQREQGAGIEMLFRITPIHRRVSPDEDTAIFMDEFEITMVIDGVKNVLPLRLTSVFEFLESNWKLVHLHGSKAVETEGDTWHMEEWKKKNEELQRMVDEKTADLAEKNRELEMEAALERVRTVAMSMHKPDALLDVCQIISEQLEMLNVNNIRNVQVAIINESKKSYSNYQFFAAYAKRAFEETGYENNPASKGMVQEMQKSANSFFIGSIKDEELEKFTTWRNEHGQFPDPIMDDLTELFYYFYSIGEGGLGLTTYEAISESELEIFKRFHLVFKLAYRRFMDIQQAEAQAHKAQIELSLERVRARAMAMQRSDELKEVIHVVYEQLIHLNILVEHAGFIMDYKNRQDMHIWLADKHAVPSLITIPYFDSPHWNSFIEAKEKNTDFFANHLTNDEKNKFYQKLFELVPGVSEETMKYYLNCPGLAISTVLLENVGLYIENFSGIPYSDEENNTLKLFGKVFQQTYTRFLDLQKAEAQAKEARIEAALEKIRSRALAMRNSAEVGGVSTLLFSELEKMDINPSGFSIMIFDEENDKYELWRAKEVPHQGVYETFSIKAMFDKLDQYVPGFGEKLKSSWTKGNPFFIGEFRENRRVSFLQANREMANYSDEAFEKMKRMFPDPTFWHLVFFKYGWFGVLQNEQLPEEDLLVIHRFAEVFDFAYTRFLDLQKAEAQAREAKIEAALERVRSRSLAMHKTDELQSIIQKVHQELLNLNISISGGSFIAINSEIETEIHCWGSGGTADTSEEVHIPYFDKPFYTNLLKGIKTGPGFFTEEYTQEEKIEFFRFLFKHEPWSKLDSKQKNETLSSPGGYTRSCCVSQHSCIFIINHFGEKFSEADNDILKRFAKVFDQAYTRFLDLQKSEKQAREAHIEAALERTRTQSMLMQQSDEILNISAVFHQQLLQLNIPTEFSYVWLPDEQKNDHQFWASWEEDDKGNKTIKSKQVTYPLDKSESYTAACYAAWASPEPTHIQFIPPADVPAFFDVWQELLDGAKKLKARFFPQGIYYAEAYMRYGCFGINIRRELSQGEKEVLKKFSIEFERAYTRFLDLRKAEEQAKEAQIELSLERIRSHVTAMQESSELLDIVVMMRNEFVTLGHEAHYFWHMRWLPEKYEKAMTSGDGTRIGMVMTLPRHIHGDIQTVADWEKSDKPTFVLAMDAENAVDYVHKMITLGDFEIVDHNAPTLDDIRHIGGLTFVMARTTHGEIGFSLPGAVPNPPTASVDALARFAGVFDLAYKRFEDLKTAEKDLIEIKAARQNAEEALLELKATQSLLIQSEKMASLGELTAGIAHEIQNPLNFVNNFSEVNMELITELKEELEAGNLEDVKAIADDIAINEEKILQHGKRADAIVKGMLQHSRSSNGIKEPADINALADEYLRLSYHGLRAKDKSFNADFTTDFDPNLPKIEIIPQDMGRVILNLINNAFYACAEKKLIGLSNLSDLDNDYQPTVTVSTNNLGNHIELSVKDNGNGIPDEIKNKIFQPFFTTKPTGAGTGLGLSLSYDIVKAHGGELKAESHIGEGTKFIITLPISKIN